MLIERANIADAKEILDLQKLAYQSEAAIYNDYSIPPLAQSLDQMLVDFRQQVVLKATLNGSIVGSVRAYLQDGTCHIGRLIVHPEGQNRGIGTSLMNRIEQHFSEARRYELFTGERSARNLYLYQKLGYRIFRTARLTDKATAVFLEKAGSSVEDRNEWHRS
jgi:ribosomal protein S18 acetylase RimI-like enzyme